MSDHQQGRGRARGRGRGAPADGQGGRARTQQFPPLGGQGAQRPPAPQQYQQQHQQQPPVQRPPQQPQPQPQQQMQQATAAMQTMKIAEGGATAARGNDAITGRGGMRPSGALCTRPPSAAATKQGSTGTKITLKANYFRLLTQPKWTLYQYRVDFVPDTEDRTMVRRSMMRDHKAQLGGYIFDGTVLYTTVRLKDNLVLHSKRKEDEQTFAIHVKLVGDVVPGDYVYFQVFNILMRHCYSALKLQLVGRDFFDQTAKVDIREHNLQIWPGYRTTIQQYEDSILMVAEITHKVVRLDTVWNLLREVQQNARGHYQAAFSGEIIGQIVLTDYNSKTYKVSDVNWELTPLSTFTRNGEECTYLQYYQEKYQVTIRDHSQPLLVSLAKARDLKRGMSEFVMLVPELCRMTGITDKMRANFDLMRSIANYTRVAPDARVNKLLAFNKRLCNEQAAVKDLQEWQMTLDNKLIDIPARELAQETIYQGQDPRTQKPISYPSGDTKEGWNRSLRSNRLVTGTHLQRWVVIVPQRLAREAANFNRMVMDNGSKMDIRFEQPMVFELPNDSVAIYLNKIEEVISTHNPQLLMCIIMSAKPDIYNAIKKKCTVDRGITSQVVTGRTMNNKNAMSIATKVAIQIHCKLGGCPWSVSIPPKRMMVIGYDVCHSTKSRSYGAMVASLDEHFSKFYSDVQEHKENEEIANEFGISIKKAMTKFRERNGALPAIVLIYRDGVGDGQIPYVFDNEVKVIESALKDMYAGQPFKMSFIIVSKRLNTRFFFNNQNPKPGTIVDSVVTLPERYDFYLISQPVRDGTVAPTSYNVLYDTSGWSPDQLQRITYKLCHLYYNCSAQVRVPAPCQYAHKLAFLAAQSLNRAPHANLASTLHFL